MVGGDRQHDRFRVPAGGPAPWRRRSPAPIAPHRLDHHRRLDADFFSLPPGKKVEIRPGDDDRGANIASCTRSRVSW